MAFIKFALFLHVVAIGMCGLALGQLHSNDVRYVGDIISLSMIFGLAAVSITVLALYLARGREDGGG